MNIVVSIALGLVPLAAAALLWRRVSKFRHVPGRLTLIVVAGGAALGVVAVYLERLVLAWTGLSFRAQEVGVTGALLATLLLAAPLEEALKVVVVWPLYATRQLISARLGLTYAACAGAGFAASESVLVALAGSGDSWLPARVVVGMSAHMFFAGLWGYALGSPRSRARWFPVAWLTAVVLHALYDHIIFGRGPGLLVVALPMLLAMLLFAWLGLREVAPRSDSRASSRSSALLSSLPEPPSLRAMRRALRRTDRPLMLHWIAIGALVTLGVMLVCVVGAVYVGHVVGIDFAVADESDVRSSGPLVLVGSGLLSGFPIAGYLVARASAATSVLEPAMGAAVAIVATVAMLSLAAPVAVVFALAVAPVAFALACGGAWFGLAR